MTAKKLNLKSIEVDGIDHRDAPKYCDAHVSYAEWVDGTELTELELDKLNSDIPSDVYTIILEAAFDSMVMAAEYASEGDR